MSIVISVRDHLSKVGQMSIQWHENCTIAIHNREQKGQSRQSTTTNIMDFSEGISKFVRIRPSYPV